MPPALIALEHLCNCSILYLCWICDKNAIFVEKSKILNTLSEKYVDWYYINQVPKNNLDTGIGYVDCCLKFCIHIDLSRDNEMTGSRFNSSFSIYKLNEIVNGGHIIISTLSLEPIFPNKRLNASYSTTFFDVQLNIWTSFGGSCSLLNLNKI